jgi:glycosyltransferase involved in cell wall biosynthesis
MSKVFESASLDRASPIRSLQLIGSKSFGGAERWVQRFSLALQQMGQPTEIGVRRGYELDQDRWGGVKRHALAMRSVWDPVSRWEVGRLIKHLQPDIVQTYMGRATRLTHIDHGAGPVHVARLGGYYKLDGYRHAHAWIGNTKGICDYLIRNGFPAERIFHIYNFYEPGDNQGERQSREAWGIPRHAWVIMTPGRQVPVKGHSYLLDAMSRLPAEIHGRPLWLVLLGEGPLQRSLQQQAHSLGIEERLIWTGWQSNPTPFYHLCDLVVFPSLDRETFGNVILEAWAYNRPLVTTAFRGAREIVSEEDNGIMAPCENANALAQAIETTLRDEALMNSLVISGRNELKRVFSKTAVLSQYIELYRNLIG